MLELLRYIVNSQKTFLSYIFHSLLIHTRAYDLFKNVTRVASIETRGVSRNTHSHTIGRVLEETLILLGD